jgi:sigma-B regulation protein RsbU (phosphoserine phosphatase)
MKSSTSSDTIIRSLPKEKCHTQSIRKIAWNLHYIDQRVFVNDLMDAFNEDEHIAAVGVVDSETKIVGIIVQNEISALLSRPYGRDVLRKKTAADMCVQARRFNIHQNIFSVAEEIDEEMKAPGISYFLLEDDDGSYRGIFSTKAMLIYLSNLTTQDIAIARRLQSRVVKEREYIDTDYLEILASSSPAKGVGGDFYSINKYSDSNWLCCICDVSGKGVAASVITSVLWGIMSIYQYGRGMKALVKDLNDTIVQTFEGEKFVTGVFADFNEVTGKVIICDMGHSHLHVFREGKLHHLKTNSSNVPIGIVPDSDPIVNSFQLHEKDILFLLTDGLIEQPGVDGKEYSLERVESAMVEKQRDTLELLHEHLTDDFTRFRGNKQVHDDVTYMLLRYIKSSTASSPIE